MSFFEFFGFYIISIDWKKYVNIVDYDISVPVYAAIISTFIIFFAYMNSHDHENKFMDLLLIIFCIFAIFLISIYFYWILAIIIIYFVTIYLIKYFN